MQTTHYKLNQFVILCRGIGAAASMLALFANVQTMKAADGDLDPTFGVGGKVMTDFNHSTDWANAVAIQPDGKFVVVGTTYKQNDFSDEDFAVARYNTDGTLDSSFGSGGKVHTDFTGLAAAPSSVLLQPAAHILSSPSWETLRWCVTIPMAISIVPLATTASSPPFSMLAVTRMRWSSNLTAKSLWPGHCLSM